MATPDNAERQQQYQAERDMHIQIAEGRLAVSRAIGYWPESLSLTPTDNPKLYSITAADPELVTREFAAVIESVDDVYELGPWVVFALIEADTRWRHDYTRMRNLLACREPTLPIAFEASQADHMDGSLQGADRVTELRLATCASSMARVALYQELSNLSVLDVTAHGIPHSPASVAATL